MGYCWLTLGFIWILAVFSLSSSCFESQSSASYCVYLACLWVFSKSFLVCDSFMTLTVLRSTGQVSCRMYSILDLSDLFIMIRFEFWFFGRNTVGVKCPSPSVTSEGTWYPHEITITLTFIIWLRLCLPGFSNSILLKQVTTCSSPFWVGGLGNLNLNLFTWLEGIYR